MGRAVLLAGALCWSLGALAAFVVALLGVERILASFPDLAIDAEAVRGAAVAVGVALAVGAVAHLAVLAALRARRRVAWSAAVLLCGLALAVFLALGAAAFASAAAEPQLIGPLVAGGLAAMLVAAAYGLGAVCFVLEIRDGRPIDGGR